MSEIQHILSEYERKNFLDRVRAHVEELVPLYVESALKRVLREVINDATDTFTVEIATLVLRLANKRIQEDK